MFSYLEMRFSCMCSHPIMLQPFCGYGHGYFIDPFKPDLVWLSYSTQKKIGTCWPQKHIPFMIFHYIPTSFPTVYSNDMSHPDKWSPQPPTSRKNHDDTLVVDLYDFVSWDDEIPNSVNPGWINPKRLFNWEGTIKKYQIMTIGGAPPN